MADDRLRKAKPPFHAGRQRRHGVARPIRQPHALERVEHEVPASPLAPMLLADDVTATAGRIHATAHGRVTGDSNAGSVTIGRTPANTTIVLVNSSCGPLMAVSAQDVFAVNHQARDYSPHEIPSVARIWAHA
jgi:hypothetical protein